MTAAPLAHPPARLTAALLWPGLLLACVAATALGMAHGHGPLAFGISYALLAVSLWRLERRWPHEAAWLRNDGQMLPDLLHTAVSKAAAYYVVVAGTQQGWFDALRLWPELWPTHWPTAAQVLLGLALAEAGFYWAHRVSHEWARMWPFHAVHHSVTRLWFFNTGRFHLVDTLRSTALGLPPLLLAGAPDGVLTWVSAVTAFIGLLTHCNVQMRTGALDHLFNTPALHRWHHSPVLPEGNTNYGENLVLWDQLFGTWYRPRDRHPPRDIGIREHMPDSYTGQLAAPFRWRAIQARQAGIASQASSTSSTG
jgi:ornithine lipid hydroxylase